MQFTVVVLQRYLPITTPSPTTGSSPIWWIGLSGGLDSCVLLHSLASLSLPVQLHAIHVNHQISRNAQSWQSHCAAVCEALNVPFTAFEVNVVNTGHGLEDAARTTRYRIFESQVKEGDYLFTAHHADDQTETLLLRLMRGSGPRGLGAMARERKLGAGGTLYRPLLDFTRKDLEEYAEREGLTWVNDESNSNDRYDRNFLRNQVLPLLRERWPQLTQKWQQTADLCAANERLLEELAIEDISQANLRTELIGTSVDMAFLQNLSLARRHNTLRFWLRTHALDIPEQRHLTQIEQQLNAGRQDAEANISWGNVSLRVFRGRLYALPIKDLPVGPNDNLHCSISLCGQNQHVINLGSMELGFQVVEPGTKPLLRLDVTDLEIRFRSGGERCKPVGRAHSQTLKRLLQEYDVAPWLRENLPLVYSGDELVAVADLWICEGYQAPANAKESRGYCLTYSPRRN